MEAGVKMKYRVILIEQNEDMLLKLSSVIKSSQQFNLVATYHDVKSALGQGSMFQPDLFLIDMEPSETSELISRFAVIFPQASILGTLNKWNADIADKALEEGMQGCLLKPFSVADIFNTLNLYQRRGKAEPPRIMAFFSPKGRSGRTTLASIMAIELAHKSGESVALIDADLQFGDLPIFFDVNPKHTIVEASHDINLLTPEGLLPYFEPLYDEKFCLLSSPIRPEYAELIEVEKLKDVVRMSGQLFRYVLVDLPSGFNPVSVSLCEQADTNFLVAMLNSGQEIEHMKRSMRLFETWERYGKKVYTVFTRVSPCNEEGKQNLEQDFGRPVSKILPNEYILSNITASGRLLKDLPDGSKFVECVKSIADDIVQGKR